MSAYVAPAAAASPKGKKQATPGTSAEAKRLKEAAEKDIRRTKEKIRLNEEEVKKGLADLNRLSSDIATGQKQVAALQGKVGTLQGEISTLGKEISKNEAELARMRQEYLKAVKKMRLAKKNQSALAFVFASENFNQAMRRIRYLRQFSKWRDKKSADIDAKIAQLSGEREKLAKIKDIHASTLSDLSASQKSLERKHVRQEQLVADLRRNGDVLQTHLSAKQKEANQLNASISALIAREQEKAEAERRAREKAEADKKAREKAAAEQAAAEKAAAERAAAAEREAAEKAAAAKAATDKAEKERLEKERKAAAEKAKKERKEAEKKAREAEKRKKNSEKGSRSRRGGRSNKQEAAPAPAPAPKVQQPTVETTDFASMRGSLPRPVDGSWRVTNPFGRHAVPGLGDVFYDNPGIDAEVAQGATVKAVCAGRVSGIYKVEGYGTVVIVNHGGYFTAYGNLTGASVSTGSQVRAGQKLGNAAPDPDDRRRGSVHFEVWKGREKQNPELWIR